MPRVSSSARPSRFSFAARQNNGIEENWLFRGYAAKDPSKGFKGDKMVALSIHGFDFDLTDDQGAACAGLEDAYSLFPTHAGKVDVFAELYDPGEEQLADGFSDLLDGLSSPDRHIHIESIHFVPGFATHGNLQFALAKLLGRFKDALEDPDVIITMGADAIKGLKLDIRTAHARIRSACLEPFSLIQYGDILVFRGAQPRAKDIAADTTSLVD